MPKPELVLFDGRVGPAEMFLKDQRAHIPLKLDRAYRRGLLAGVNEDGGPQARYHIRIALEAGPSRGGAEKTMQFFGAGLSEKLKLTAQIVDGLEIAMPGFKKWLEMTGFGDDCRMVRGFVGWAEHKLGVGRVIPQVKPAFKGVQ